MTDARSGPSLCAGAGTEHASKPGGSSIDVGNVLITFVTSISATTDRERDWVVEVGTACGVNSAVTDQRHAASIGRASVRRDRKC